MIIILAPLLLCMVYMAVVLVANLIRRPFILREPEDWTINLRERRR